MKEQKLRKIINEELNKMLKKGFKVGEYSIHLTPTYIDMENNELQNVGLLTPTTITEKTATFVLRKNGSIYEAISGITGLVVYSSSDCGVVLNSCRSAIISDGIGGSIFVRDGVYTCTTAFTGGNAVDIVGESMGPFEDFAKGVVFVYSGSSTDAFLDYRACRQFNLINFKIKNTGSAVRGLYCGDTTNSANKSKAITLQNIVIDGFDYGIQGDTFGPDDSVFIHVIVQNCSSIGVDNLSSQCRWFGGAIASSPIGLRIKRAAGSSADASMQMYGTVWSGCDVCIDIAGYQNINILNLDGCWFENTTALILDTSNALPGISLGSVYFHNCVGTVNSATATAYFDLSGINIDLQWVGGTLYSDTAKDIITNGSGGTIQRIRIMPQAGLDKINMNDSNDGSRGFAFGIIPMLDDANGVQGGVVGGTYTSTWQSSTANINPLYVVKAHACYRWTPNSTSGKIRLYAIGVVGASEPGSSGARYDEVECTSEVRSGVNSLGDIDIQTADDGLTAVLIKYVVLIYQY